MTDLLDPFGVAGRALGAARTGFRLVAWCERQALTVLRDKLAALEPHPQPHDSGADLIPVSLNAKMRLLQDRALDQGTRASELELYHRLLDQLVADEARIIGALSDGSASPLVNVNTWTKTHGSDHSMLTNASLIGRTANIALPQTCPQYVSHLLALGLVEIGPEDPAMKSDYEVLMAETMVLDAIKHGSRGPLAARVEKLTLKLSSLGQSFWAATTQGDRR